MDKTVPEVKEIEERRDKYLKHYKEESKREVYEPELRRMQSAHQSFLACRIEELEWVLGLLK